MSDANNEITSRKSNLFSKLEQAEKKHNRKANIYEILSAASFYLSLSFGGLAVLSGLIKSFNVPPEIISVFAAISSGLTVLPRQALFRLKADWHYSARDTANNLLWKLQFEMPDPLTLDSLLSISKEWVTRRNELGMRMQGINSTEVQKKP